MLNFKRIGLFIKRWNKKDRSDYYIKYSLIPVGTSEEDLCLVELLVKFKPMLLSDPKIASIVEEAKLRTPEKIQEYYKNLKDLEYSKFNKVEKWFLFMEVKVIEFKKYVRDLMWKIKKNIDKNPLYESTVEDEDLFKLLLRQGKLINRQVDKTVEIKANIEKHAEGKIVSAIWKRPVRLSDSVKIKSYNIVPGKDPLQEDEEDFRCRHLVGTAFMPEGCLPEEIPFGSDEPYMQQYKV